MSCTEGKYHQQKFLTSSETTTEKPLDLVHSDVCGKINVKSLSGAEYFLTLIDEKTCYVWVYVLKHKSEVFDKFLEWKALVEKSSGQKGKDYLVRFIQWVKQLFTTVLGYLWVEYPDQTTHSI